VLVRFCATTAEKTSPRPASTPSAGYVVRFVTPSLSEGILPTKQNQRQDYNNARYLSSTARSSGLSSEVCSSLSWCRSW
jgi:hypothetical protein